jgi:hypothetical protein
MRIIIFAVALLFAVSLAFADIGPGPSKPGITIWMQENGATHTEIDEITYHCNGTDNQGNGSVEISTLNIPCVKGACRNSDWYYKFNPCFYSSGYFSYNLSGQEKKSEWIDFLDSKKYEYSLDMSTGKFKEIEQEPACLGGFILPGLLVGTICALLVRR